MEEIFQMSKKEIDRIKTLELVRERKITQRTAALKLNISDRQVRNLLKSLNSDGEKALISKKRGKKGNHSKTIQFKLKVLELVNKHYSDFGPKLASEYLKKNHRIHICDETLRLWMINCHMWIPKKRENHKHLPRERRKAFGELVQIDGSHHYWFEERGPPCVLMVMVDDATSMITALRFEETENLEAYYRTFAAHIESYGIPFSLYGDRCSVLCPRREAGLQNATQFQKAASELGTKVILAHSPQAKGKVERTNRTLQDRLVKMLRLRGASTIEEGNKYLEEYRDEHNKYFSKKPIEQANAHRLLDGISLDHVLCIREVRTLTKDSIVQFRNNFYQISSQDNKTRLHKGAKIEIRTLLNGTSVAFFKGKRLNMIHLGELETPILEEKEVKAWKDKKIHIPDRDHPYKKLYNRNVNRKKKEEECLENVI